MMSLVLLALLLVPVAILAASVARRFRARRAPAVGGPACGACGYSAQGLGSLTCPECGGDFRAVGIVTPRTPAPGWGFGAAAFVFTALLAGVTVPLTGALVAMLPARVEYASTFTLTGPASGAYHAAAATSRVRGWARATMPLTIDLTLVPVPAGRAGAATTRPLANTAPLRLGGGPPDPAAIRAWMRSAGLDLADPRVSAEADRIAMMVRDLARDRFRHARAQYSGWTSSRSGGDESGAFQASAEVERGSARPPEWAAVPMAAVWVALWLLGLRHLWRVTRGPG